jgi:hypothetical protein
MKNFDKRLFLGLVLSFIPFMILLVLTHELGHYFAMRSVGMDARIHYYGTEPLTFFRSFSTRSKLIWITVSGPLVTIILGITGIVLLSILKRRFPERIRLSRWQWAMVLLSLFWVRQVFGFVLWIASKIGIYKPIGIGDEVKLAWLLNLPRYTFFISLLVISIAVICIIIFRFIPQKQRITFIFSTITGLILSYFAWFRFLGKLLLP